MKRSKIIRFNRLGDTGTFAMTLADGSRFIYNEEQIKNLVKNVKENYPTRVNSYKDMIGMVVTGDWHAIKAGDTVLLDENHPLVTRGASIEGLQVVRKGKTVELSLGEKAQVGDTYVYPASDYNRVRHNEPPTYDVDPFEREVAYNVAAMRLAEMNQGFTISNTVSTPTGATPTVEESDPLTQETEEILAEAKK